MQVMDTLQRFIANYSRINQSSRWGLSLGLGFCVTGHMPGPTRWEMRRPGEKASGPARNLGWVPSPRGGALACTERAPRKALCHRTCLGRSRRGWGGLRETLGQSRESDRGAGRGGGEGGEPQEPRPRGQQMRGRCEVPRRGGKPAVGAGRPCDVNVGRPRPAGRSPTPLRSVICQGARGGGTPPGPL